MDIKIRADQLGVTHLGQKVEIRPGVVIVLDRIEYASRGAGTPTLRVMGSSQVAGLQLDQQIAVWP